jgi:hypothetical protein
MPVMWHVITQCKLTLVHIGSRECACCEAYRVVRVRRVQNTPTRPDGFFARCRARSGMSSRNGHTVHISTFCTSYR